MKPYYEKDGIVIYHGDCREVLPVIEESVDIMVTDPPYGIDLSNHDPGGRRRSAGFEIVGDGCSTIGNFAAQWCYVRDVPAIFFAHSMNPWPCKWRQHLVWDKGPAVGGGGDPDYCWKMTWELIQVARTKALNGPRDEAILRYHIGPLDSRLHPAQKPVPLLAYLIEKSAVPGNVVDPFMGSGTTLRAAKDLGRKAIGIEIEERYCEIAAKRLEQGILPCMAGSESA